MDVKFKSFLSILFITVLAVIIQSCAGTSHATADNVRIYNKNINRMTNVTRHAIRSCGQRLKVSKVDQRDNETDITFVKRVAAGHSVVNSQTGNVVLTKVDTANATKVRVENPEYSYGTPTELRLDYPTILFKEIDKLLQ